MRSNGQSALLSDSARRVLDFGDLARPADLVVLGDSAALAASWPTATLDAVYVDPPFGTGTVRRGRGHQYDDVDGDPEVFVAWLRPWLEESRRALAPRGSLFVHLDWRTVHHVKVELDRVFGRGCFAGELIWCYAVGGKSRRGFGRKHDTILWYGRTPEWTFHADAVRVARRGGSHMRVVTGADGTPVQEKTDRRPGASTATRSPPARSPRTGGPTSRRSTTPIASAPAGRRRSRSG